LSEDSLIRQLMTSSRCEVCGRSYEEENIVILGHQAEMWVLKINCPACHSQSLLAALIGEDKVTEPATDLAEPEIEKFKEMLVINGNEVLDMHNLLRDYKGNFTGLF
jgi:hypothetical protein